MSEQRPSEMAMNIARLVRNGGLVDELSAVQIHQALAHRLGWDPIGERVTLLGPLTRMMMETGEVLSYSAYEAARGPKDTPASTLSDNWGGWPGVQKAAVRCLAGERTPRRVSAERFGPERYTTGEVVNAIIRCKQELNYWPVAVEFYLWGRIKRRLARETGRPDPRVPTPAAVRKHFARFELALEEAERAEERRRGSGPKRPRGRQP
jgi:hypothetical protein